jgi:insulysin
MVTFYKENILPSSAVRSKLAVHFEVQAPTKTQVEGTIGEEWMRSLGLDGTKDGDGDEVFTDVAEFKSRMKAMEAPQLVKDIEQFEDLDEKVE